MDTATLAETLVTVLPIWLSGSFVRIKIDSSTSKLPSATALDEHVVIVTSSLQYWAATFIPRPSNEHQCSRLHPIFLNAEEYGSRLKMAGPVTKTSSEEDLEYFKASLGILRFKEQLAIRSTVCGETRVPCEQGIELLRILLVGEVRVLRDYLGNLQEYLRLFHRLPPHIPPSRGHGPLFDETLMEAIFRCYLRVTLFSRHIKIGSGACLQGIRDYRGNGC